MALSGDGLNLKIEKCNMLESKYCDDLEVEGGQVKRTG